MNLFFSYLSRVPFLYKYFGTVILLSLELILTLWSIILLFSLPDPPSAKTHALTLKQKIMEIKETAVFTLHNPNINLYILYSALLFSTTSLFCWCFQPLLRLSDAPVLLFGLVYVINHALRAGFSFYVNRLKRFFGFNRLLAVTTFLCLYSFGCMILGFHFHDAAISSICLFFVCIGIGFQLAFALANTSHIHTYAKEETRATISSVSNMLQQTISGISLICFKFVVSPDSDLSGLGFSGAFIVFGIIYMSIFVFLFYKISHRKISES